MRVRIILLLPALLLLLLMLLATSSADLVAAVGSDKSGSRSAGGASSGSPWAIDVPDDSARGRHPDGYVRRVQRNTISEEKPWITTDANQYDIFFKMHAFIVRDKNIPKCGSFAEKVTKERFYICSGAVLSKFYVLTSASCINSARFDHHNIGGDLAVLTGALEENSHLTKILQYKIHPNYKPHPGSIDHQKHNLALLTLACPIFPRQIAVIPKLPSTMGEDAGHLCCSGSCKLATVVQNSKNQHFLRLIKTQHVPPPLHVNVNKISKRSFVYNMKLPLHKLLNRYIREPDKESITDPPDKSASTQSPSSDDAVGSRMTEEDTADTTENTAKHTEESTAINTTENTTENTEGNTATDTTENTAENTAADTTENTVKHTVETIASDTTENTAKHTAENTAKNTATDTTKNTAASTTKNTATSTEKVTEKENEKKNEMSNNNGKAELILEKNVSCPPLGSPVIYNGTLIALIAYTCSDEQNWVPWKYVNILENIKWINSEKKRRINSNGPNQTIQ